MLTAPQTEIPDSSAAGVRASLGRLPPFAWLSGEAHIPHQTALWFPSHLGYLSR